MKDEDNKVFQRLMRLVPRHSIFDEAAAAIERLSAERDRFEVMFASVNDDLSKTEAELANLRAQIAADAKDAERLNWLGQHDGKFYNIDKIASIVGSGFSHNGFIWMTESLRSAIDAAMKSE